MLTNARFLSFVFFLFCFGSLFFKICSALLPFDHNLLDLFFFAVIPLNLLDEKMFTKFTDCWLRKKNGPLLHEIKKRTQNCESYHEAFLIFLAVVCDGSDARQTNILEKCHTDCKLAVIFFLVTVSLLTTHHTSLSLMRKHWNKKKKNRFIYH